MRVKSPEREQLELLHHSPRTFSLAVMELARSKLSGSMVREQKALNRLQTLLGETLILANLFGRRRMWLMAAPSMGKGDERDGRVIFAETPVVPDVPFEEAISDILGRQARVVTAEHRALQAAYLQVQEFYAEGKSFALAKSSSDEITKKIQQHILSFQREGKSVEEAGAVIASMGDWAKSYGEVVYRTNANTAYNAGIKQMTTDPDVAEVAGAFQLEAVKDPTTRPGHKWASGLVAGIHDPIWKFWSPPLGYNCRCSLRMISRFNLKRDFPELIEPNGMVKIKTPPNWSRAKADPGFPGYQG